MKTFTLYLPIILGAMLIFAAAVRSEADHPPKDNTGLAKATFAGGCFWCMEPPFEKKDGITSVTSGYTGGFTKDPNYNNYAEGGHIEAIEIIYDPLKISYQKLLELFWQQIDPTDPDGQFVDRGRAYSTAIFYHDEEQKELAEESKQQLAARDVFDKPIVTPILPAVAFYAAEEHHQDYYTKNPLRYKYYRGGSGRDAFLEKIWGQTDSGLSKQELKARLTPLQYKVTQEDGTEPAFDNLYWNNKQPGIYVDVVSGEPLFSSNAKYDSGTGWPSFTRPLVAKNIAERQERKLFTVRTEVRSKKGDSHLGHVFADGPPPAGLRYCINSAALRFIAKADLEKEGYGEFLPIFADPPR